MERRNEGRSDCVNNSKNKYMCRCRRERKMCWFAIVLSFFLFFFGYSISSCSAASCHTLSVFLRSPSSSSSTLWHLNVNDLRLFFSLSLCV